MEETPERQTVRGSVQRREWLILTVIASGRGDYVLKKIAHEMSQKQALKTTREELGTVHDMLEGEKSWVTASK